MKPILITTVLLLSITGLNGQSAENLIEKGQRNVQNGHYEEALSYYNESIALMPENQDAYLKRAFVYSLLKDYEQAISDYSKVIDLNPTFALAYLSRGSAYNKLEKFELAISDFNKVIELDPENSEAYNNRGWSKKGLNDKKGACKDWKRSKKMGNSEAKIILKNNQC